MLMSKSLNLLEFCSEVQLRKRKKIEQILEIKTFNEYLILSITCLGFPRSIRCELLYFSDSCSCGTWLSINYHLYDIQCSQGVMILASILLLKQCTYV